MVSPDQETLYSKQLMSYAQSVATPHRLDHPDATGHASSMICGSEITIDLTLDQQGKIATFGYEIAACSLTKTALAIVKEAVIGQSRDEIAAAGALLSQILENEAEPPVGHWSHFEFLLPCREYPARHQSILLVFEAIEDAYSQIKNP